MKCHEVLRHYMDENELSADQLAERSGFDRSQIYRYLRGSNVPRLDAAKRLAVAVGCTLEELAEEL